MMLILLRYYYYLLDETGPFVSMIMGYYPYKKRRGKATSTSTSGRRGDGISRQRVRQVIVLRRSEQVWEVYC